MKAKPGAKRWWRGIYCPLLSRWIGENTSMEVSGTRNNYSEALNGVAVPVDARDDFIEEGRKAGWVLPKQLAEAVFICGYCESHCLGRNDGPAEIPEYTDERAATLFTKMYGAD